MNSFFTFFSEYLKKGIKYFYTLGNQVFTLLIHINIRLL